MAKKQKISEFWKENKKEILIGVGVITASGLLGGFIGGRTKSTKYPYEVTIGSDNKEYIDAIKGLMNWGRDTTTNGAYICYGVTDAKVKEVFSELLSEESDKYMYSMILERIDKTKLK